MSLLSNTTHAHSESLERPFISVQKPGAKVGSTAAVDDGAANDVGSFLEREAFGNAVVNDGGKIAMNKEGNAPDDTQGDWVWPQYPD